MLLVACLALGAALSGRMILPNYFDDPSPGGATFDCGVELAHWQTFWTDEKKAYCCQSVGYGCEPDFGADQQFDCNAARANWQAAWSEAKKKFCCMNGGCPDGVKEFDCSGTEADWSTDKKDWCCKEHDKGCARDEPYDCRAGVTNWQNGWSDHKKYWCCKRYDVACPHPVVYDCDAGYGQWESVWSSDKKAWCCGRLHRGCHEETPETPETPETHVVQVPVPAPVYIHHVHHIHHVHPTVHVVGEQWLTEPQPPAAEVHQAYDCWSSSGSVWSDAHRHFCCGHHHIGCGDHVHVTHVVYRSHTSASSYGNFDCTAGISNWRAGWSAMKKQYCCDHFTLGCEESDALSGGGVVSSGSGVTSSGSGVISSGDGVVSSGGDVVSSGGDVVSSGDDVVSSGGGVMSSGGDVVSGNMVEDTAEGIETGVDGDSVADTSGVATIEGDVSGSVSGGDVANVADGVVDGLDTDASAGVLDDGSVPVTDAALDGDVVEKK